MIAAYFVIKVHQRFITCFWYIFKNFNPCLHFQTKSTSQTAFFLALLFWLTRTLFTNVLFNCPDMNHKIFLHLHPLQRYWLFCHIARNHSLAVDLSCLVVEGRAGGASLWTDFLLPRSHDGTNQQYGQWTYNVPFWLVRINIFAMEKQQWLSFVGY
jgi:hypothetical protein